MINFPFGINGKFIILGVPILKLITVIPIPHFHYLLVNQNNHWISNYLMHSLTVKLLKCMACLLFEVSTDLGTFTICFTAFSN